MGPGRARGSLAGAGAPWGRLAIASGTPTWWATWMAGFDHLKNRCRGWCPRAGLGSWPQVLFGSRPRHARASSRELVLHAAQSGGFRSVLLSSGPNLAGFPRSGGTLSECVQGALGVRAGLRSCQETSDELLRGLSLSFSWCHQEGQSWRAGWVGSKSRSSINALPVGLFSWGYFLAPHPQAGGWPRRLYPSPLRLGHGNQRRCWAD